MTERNNESRKRLRARDANELVDFSPTNIKRSTARAITPTPTVGCTSQSSCTPISATPPTPSPWQLPSSSHCVACGKISCNCRGRVDPEEKRRRLEKLRLNTPYERAKALRLTDELQAEERKKRCVIESEWITTVCQIFTSHRFVFHIMNFVHNEDSRRFAIVEEEYQQRQDHDQTIYQARCALQVHETESKSRALLINKESEERSCLLSKLSTQLFLFAQEEEDRSRTETQELLERQEKRARMEEHSRQLYAWRAKACEVENTWRQGQEMHYQIWKKENDQLIGKCEWAVQTQKKYEEERVSFARLVLNGKVDIRKEEANRRDQLYLEMRDSKELLLTMLFQQQEERMKIFDQESKVRIGIQGNWVDQMEHIRKESVASIEAARISEDKRNERVQLEMNKILRAKEAVQMEEIISFGELLVKEREEREDCIRWVKEREERAFHFAEWCFTQKIAVVKQESDARNNLLQNFAEAYDFWIQWEEKKIKQQHEFFCAESEARTGLEANEHNHFFDLYHLRGEAESSVIRLQARKKEERISLLRVEENVRRIIHMNEEQERETMFLELSFLLDEDRTRTASISHELNDLVLRAMSLRTAIMEDESQYRQGLTALFQTALVDAREVCFHRLYCQMEAEESHRRSFISLEEITGRGRLTELHQIHADWLHDAQVSRWQRLLEEVVQEECIARTGIIQREELILRNMMAGMKLTEDDIVKQCTSTVENNCFDSVPTAPCLEKDPTVSAIREDLVLKTLTGLTTSALEYLDIMYASQLIEGLSECRSSIQHQKRKIAVRAEEFAARADTMERVFEEKKEQKDQYGKNCKRSREQLERIEQDLKTTRKRFRMEVELKQKELANAEKQLEEENNALQACKDVINAKLSRSVR